MRWMVLTLALLLAPHQAKPWGLSADLNLVNPQVIGLAGANLDDNLAAGGGGSDLVGGVCSEYGHAIPCSQHYTLTRASVKYCQTSGGLWVQAASGRLCYTNLGNLIEESRTNNALRARDMTNASWTKVGMGTALNAIGIDGLANSATTLTASGTASSCTASCTSLQTVVLGSAAENYSVWLKRVTGSGVVNITLNNLSGVTACTLTTTAFTRCTVTATLANPVIGIQMVGLNDVIVADFSQLEAGAFPTSPILTTTVAATRAADEVQPINAAANIAGSAQGSWVISSLGGSNYSSAGLFGRRNGVDQIRMTASTTGQIVVNNGDGGSFTVGSGSYAGVVKTGNAWSAAGISAVGNGGTVVSGVTAYTTFFSNSVWLGSNDGSFSDQSLSRFTAWWPRIPDTQLQGLTR